MRFTKSDDVVHVLVAGLTRGLFGGLCAGVWPLLILSVTGVVRADEGRGVSTAPVRHRIMVCEYSNAAHRLVELSGDGQPAWEHPFPNIAVCFRMADDGRVIFASGGNPTGVQEVDRSHRTTFTYHAQCEQVLTLDRLPGGNMLLAEQGPCRAVEINLRGEVVSTIPLQTSEKLAHRQLRCLRQITGGHLLACHEAEGVVREYDRSGAIVWEYPGVSDVFEALRLGNGNTLIGCGTQKRVIEVTHEKKTVWELTAADVPDLNLTWITSLQVLKNGNFVIANFLRGQEGRGAHAFEITHDASKRVVWKYDAHDIVKSITMVHVLDDDEGPAF